MDRTQSRVGKKGELDTSLYLNMLERIRSEAAALCLDAREICDIDRGGTARDLTKWQQMQYRREMLLVTARLMQVMGWALSEQTAVRKGRDAAPGRRWKLDTTLAAQPEGRTARSYPHFAALIDDSLSLYQRVLRLAETDAAAGDNRPERVEPKLRIVTGGEPHASEARGLGDMPGVLNPTVD
jgi:hypothetical protein